MLLVVAKTLLTPLLLVLCTVVSRRWGDAVGGWLLGLPMVSGPVSLFLTIQHGSSFAESAARSTLLGFVAVGVFCLVYLSLAENHGWKLSLTGSVAACMATVAAFAIVHLSLAETFVAVPLALLAIGALLGARSGSASAAASWRLTTRAIRTPPPTPSSTRSPPTCTRASRSWAGSASTSVCPS